jgi:acetylornithine deacetylase/succinyl-diaminopimelate desuccinylase-like protein
MTDIDWQAAGEEAVRILSQLIQIDTTNPPGNERPAAEFLQSILDAEGIASEILEPTPGRASLIARLPGTGEAAPFLLLCHTDVVYADPAGWTHPPFSGTIADGYVWGRGTLDMKGLAVMELMTMLLCKRHDLRLQRDLIFLAAADEEAMGDHGAGWVVAEHWDKVAAAYAINEGGQGLRLGDRTVYLCAVAEKGYADLRLTARGEGGHASMPRADNPVVTIARALASLADYQAPIGETPAMTAFLDQLEAMAGTRDVDRLVELGVMPPMLAYSLRNTFSPTIVAGGRKENVIPQECQTNVNCRPLPGVTQEDLVSEVQAAVGEDEITVDVKRFEPGTESPLETDFFAVIKEVIQASDPGALVVPYLMPATTDSRFFRARGVTAYGFTPVVTTVDEMQRIHGVDERVSVENVHRGTRTLFEIVTRFCGGGRD